MAETIPQRLFAQQDPKYRQFSSALIPTVDPNTVIGVRTPALRKLAKELEGEQSFLRELPHRYYEENNLHGFLIGEIKVFDRCVRELEVFLPYVDNWATCDSLRPRCFAKHKEELLPYIRKWLSVEHEYTVRFAIEMLMVHYLDEAFEPAYLQMVAGVKREEYYVKMMVAWYFATALAKRWNCTIGYLEERKLSLWVHNKTIQKACESFRITFNQKQYLKKLKQ